MALIPPNNQGKTSEIELVSQQVPQRTFKGGARKKNFLKSNRKRTIGQTHPPVPFPPHASTAGGHGVVAAVGGVPRSLSLKNLRIGEGTNQMDRLDFVEKRNQIVPKASRCELTSCDDGVWGT